LDRCLRSYRLPLRRFDGILDRIEFVELGVLQLAPHTLEATNVDVSDDVTRFGIDGDRASRAFLAWLKGSGARRKPTAQAHLPQARQQILFKSNPGVRSAMAPSADHHD
jgi:hypothetical protein